MIRSVPTNPLVNVSVNLPLDLVLWLDDLVEASHTADDPESRSGVVRMMLRFAQTELEQDCGANSPENYD
ncbi:hypothetical protein ABS772_23675 [Methylorubrum podarium]|uniref:CopG family transcriptional regulator n=1 Tax=Methylorubrum podarium TaxID=200476 RepID=A0ABV1QU15_9HYPH